VKNCLSKTWELQDAPGNDLVRIMKQKLYLIQPDRNDVIELTTGFDIKFGFHNYIDGVNLNLSLVLYTITGNCIFNVATSSVPLKKGFHTSTLKIPGKFLNDDIYTISLFFVKDTATVLYDISDLLTFEIIEGKRESNWYGKHIGACKAGS
jgi:lipopolysaccharide transport system ATP-binding protein